MTENEPSKYSPSPGEENSPILNGGGESLELLKLLALAAGLEFDRTRAVIALRKAEADIPPTIARAARLRLAQAAQEIGLQILARQLSTHEALQCVSEQSPLAIFSVTSLGIAKWHLLARARNGEGYIASLDGSEVGAWMSAEEIARRVGATDRDSVLEWSVAVAATQLSIQQSEPIESAHSETAHHEISPLQRLLQLLRIEIKDVGIVLVYAVGVGVLSLAVPITAMAVVNTTALASLLQQLVVLCIALFLSLGISAVLRMLQSVVVEYLQQRTFVRVVSDLAFRLPRVDIRAYDQHHGPELVNRFFDVLTVQKASASLLLDGVTVALQMAMGLGLLAYYHQILLGFDLFLIAGLIFILFVLGRGAVKSSIRESKSKYVIANWIEELARHPLAFKLSGGPTFAWERADGLAREYLKARQSHFSILLRQFGFALLLQALASTVLLGLGGYLVIQGQLTLGQLVAAEIVVSLVVASFTKLGKQLENFYDLLAAVDKLGHLMDLPLERQTGVNYLPRSKGAAVKVRGVNFRYDLGHRQVLSDLDLEIEPGERVALVGPNGAGKSTLIDLLFGLREPSDGYVEIDGMDVRDIRLESLRQQMAVVKGIEIFEGTILDNVRIGRDHLTLAEIRRALSVVGLLEDILDFPAGLNTMLRTGGAPLSLGQAERLMLARAIASGPRLLVIDEVLDDMDQQVRQEVLPAILGKEAFWTLVVVTHSEEVAKLCDRQLSMHRKWMNEQRGEKHATA